MADDIIITHKFDTNENLANLLTNSLPGWKRVQLRSNLVYSYNPIIS